MDYGLKPEVLSPAGYFDMLEAAVRSGADAVYLGATEFSARRNARNFDITELKQAIDYCHIRNVRAYLTLNIIIKDSEMQAAFELAKTAYNYGIDGIIVEDLGLAGILHEKIPSLPLHASTQMSVHSPAALPMLKKLGFCQVVAAREMSEDELKVFCDKAGQLSMTVEVFVHGALCMSLSGQCLLSAMLGSRSGNRGLCAGPCRLPFSVDDGTGYDLSLKDLSLVEYIDKLSEIGVGSLKIEGRMKRPEYVAAATAACRKAVDEGRADKQLSETLKNVFSRSGFTSGYFEGKLGRDMFGIRTREDVVSADNAFPKLHEIYRSERHSVRLDIIIKVLNGLPTELTLCDGKNTVCVTGAKPEAAQNKAADRESVIANIDKFGATPYFSGNIETQIGENLFIRAGELNELRRKATDELDRKRTQLTYEKSNAEYSPAPAALRHKVSPKIYARFENAEQIPDDLSGIDALILPLEENPQLNINADIERLVDIPRGIVSEKAIGERLKLFKSHGFKSALCGNIAAFKIAEECGFKAIADTGMNIYNSESAAVAAALGAERVILSNEILMSDAEALRSPVPKGIVAYGNIPLMLFRNCPLKNGRSCNKCDKNGYITDRIGVRFPIRCRMGYSELLNSVPVWLGDKIKTVAGLDFILLYFTRESKERAEKVINAYNRGLPADSKHTRGLFYRGAL